MQHLRVDPGQCEVVVDVESLDVSQVGDTMLEVQQVSVVDGHL